MNIEGVNLLSLLPGNSAIEGGASGNDAIPGNFAGALVGQIALLSAATDQADLSGQLPGMAAPQFQSAPNRVTGELPPADSSGRIGVFVNEGAAKKDSPACAVPPNSDNLPEGRGFRPARYFNDLPEYKGGGKNLAALSDDHLALPYKKNESIDLEATLLSLTDALKSIAPTGTPVEAATVQSSRLASAGTQEPVTQTGMPDEVATVQNPRLASADAPEPVAPTGTPGKVAAVQNPRLASADAPEPAAPTGMPGEVAAVQNPRLASADAPEPAAPTGTPGEVAAVQSRRLASADAPEPAAPTGTPGKVAAVQNPRLASADAPEPAAPTGMPGEVAAVQNPRLASAGTPEPLAPTGTLVEMAIAQNMSVVIALNGFPFVKPLPEEAGFNMLGNGENAVSGDFLQKETVLRQLIQDKQGVNLQFFENVGSAEKTPVIDQQAAISELEKTMPGITADRVLFHRPVDNRIDGPAITRPLTHPDWGKDLGEQIVWMNNKTMSAAEIKLNPAHLGPISVRIDVNQDQTTLSFTAQHAEVKEAIEASIPKLREMLGTQQLNLINVNVSQNSTSDQGRPSPQAFSKPPENHAQGNEGVTDPLEKTEQDRTIVSKGLLSLYV